MNIGTPRARPILAKLKPWRPRSAACWVSFSYRGGRECRSDWTSGYVTARRAATVSSKVTGKVIEVLVEEGMKVQADQVLARLDASNVEKSFKLSEAQLESARK